MREQNKSKIFLVLILILGVLFNAPFVLAKNESQNKEKGVGIKPIKGGSTSDENYEVQVVQTNDYVTISYENKQPERVTLSWGVTADYEGGQILEDTAKTIHEFVLDDLVSGLTYYYRLDLVNEKGQTNHYHDSFVRQGSGDNILNLNDFQFTQNDVNISVVSNSIKVKSNVDLVVSIDADKIGHEVSTGVVSLFESDGRTKTDYEFVKTERGYSTNIPAMANDQELNFSITFFDENNVPVKQTTGKMIIERFDQNFQKHFDLMTSIVTEQNVQELGVNYFVTETYKKIIKFGNEHGDDA